MTIRVVSIISRMNVGGPAVLLSELIENLPEEEFEHILITGTCMANEIDYLQLHPLSSQIIYMNDVKRAVLPVNDLKSFFKLIRILRNLRPHVIHTHTSKAGVLGRLAGKIAAPGANIVHTYHGHLLYGYFPPWKIKMVVLLESLLAKITNHLVAVTNQVKIDLISAGVGKKSKWTLIRPGVEAPEKKSKSQSRKELVLNKNIMVISWIGRFTDIKNPMLAIRAIEQLPDSTKKKIRLIMVGDGELLLDCQKYATELQLPITFTGWLSDVSRVLFASDLLLMSSKNEGMPVVVIEAAIRGVPTLSTNVGGVSEFIEDGISGFLCQKNQQLSVALNEVISDTPRLQRVAHGAENLAKSEFTVRKFVDRHIELYKPRN